MYSGLNDVKSVKFALETKEKQNLEECLIADAVRDAQARATLALNAIGYNIVAIKSVQIIIPQLWLPVRVPQMLAMSESAAPPT